MPDVGHGPVLVVAERFQQNRRAAGSVSFIGALLVLDAFEFAGPFFDGPFHIILGHVTGPGIQQRTPKPGIGVGIPSADAGRYDDFLDDLGENLPALGVFRRFLVLDISPFAMPGHPVPLLFFRFR
jgi:hypothetical protein